MRAPAEARPAAAVWVQIGAFSVQEKAYAVKRRLERTYAGVAVSTLVTDRGRYYRVRIRTSEAEVRSLAERLAAEGLPVIIIRE